MKSYDFKHKGVVVRLTPQGEGWMVIWRDGKGKRMRVYRATEKKALEKAKEVCESIKSGEAVAVQLSPAELAEYGAAVTKIHPRSLLPVIDEVLAAESILGGVSLIEAARFYVGQRKAVTRKTVAEVVAEFLAAKEQDKVSEEHLRGIKSHLDRFKDRFNLPLSALTAADLDTWARSGDASPRTRKNRLGSLSNLFSFCKVRRYLSADWNELAGIAAPRCQSAPPTCYHPDQFKALLRVTQAEKKRAHVCYFVLRGMLGVRDTEAFRLKVDQIRDGHLIVEAAQAKVRGRRRIIPLHGTAGEWLKRYAPKSGLIVPLKRTGTLQRTFRRLYKLAGVPRVENALRDSFISYRMAMTKNAPLVSDEAGNSPQKIHQHYRELMLPTGELVTADLAALWFTIPPVDKT